MQASVEEKKEPKDADPKKRVKGAAGSFLSRYKMLFGGSLAVAIAVHLLLLIGFGSYTLFKGSSPRMPFTSEGGVPAEDVAMEAPPENAPDMVEETAMDSNPTPSDVPAMETDTVLAVAGAVSPSMSFNAAPPVLAAPASTGIEKRLSQPGARSGAKASSVNFFGVKGEGSNVYFVIDLSDSMLEAQRGGLSGFALVKNNVKQMVQSLDENTYFNIVLYAAEYATRFQPAAVPANPDNKKAAALFIEPFNNTVQTRGLQKGNYQPTIQNLGLIEKDATRLDLGLLAAFEGLADTIFLITDGKVPTTKEDKREQAKKAMENAAMSESDKVKYQSEVAEWRKDYEVYVQELKTYREKYKDLLAKQAEKIEEAKKKGQGKIREGKEVDYGIKIAGLPGAPKEPKQPTPPKLKVDGAAVEWSGKALKESELIQRVKDIYTDYYKKAGAPVPSIHTVGYMSNPAETKFLQALAAKNNGTFKAISAPIK
jgi:hypothetical protein